MKLSRLDARVVRKFRRSVYADSLREILDRELVQSRSRYENTLASEGQRAYILAVRSIMDVLFDEHISVDKNDH